MSFPSATIPTLSGYHFRHSHPSICFFRLRFFSRRLYPTSASDSVAKELIERFVESQRPSLALTPNNLRAQEISDRGGEVIFLLYLNRDTWRPESGAALAVELRAARAAGMHVVMMHERDEARRACPFGRLYQTTPSHLVHEDLYAALKDPPEILSRHATSVPESTNPLASCPCPTSRPAHDASRRYQTRALPMHGEPYREACLLLAAKAIGAVQVDRPGIRLNWSAVAGPPWLFPRLQRLRRLHGAKTASDKARCQQEALEAASIRAAEAAAAGSVAAVAAARLEEDEASAAERSKLAIPATARKARRTQSIARETGGSSSWAMQRAKEAVRSRGGSPELEQVSSAAVGTSEQIPSVDSDSLRGSEAALPPLAFAAEPEEELDEDEPGAQEKNLDDEPHAGGGGGAADKQGGGAAASEAGSQTVADAEEEEKRRAYFEWAISTGNAHEARAVAVTEEDYARIAVLEQGSGMPSAGADPAATTAPSGAHPLDRDGDGVITGSENALGDEEKRRAYFDWAIASENAAEARAVALTEEDCARIAVLEQVGAAGESVPATDDGERGNIPTAADTEEEKRRASFECAMSAKNAHEARAAALTGEDYARVARLEKAEMEREMNLDLGAEVVEEKTVDNEIKALGKSRTVFGKGRFSRSRSISPRGYASPGSAREASTDPSEKGRRQRPWWRRRQDESQKDEGSAAEALAVALTEEDHARVSALVQDKAVAAETIVSVAGSHFDREPERREEGAAGEEHGGGAAAGAPPLAHTAVLDEEAEVSEELEI